LYYIMKKGGYKFTNFHPQKNGKREVVNKILVQLLGGYSEKHPIT